MKYLDWVPGMGLRALVGSNAIPFEATLIRRWTRRLRAPIERAARSLGSWKLEVTTMTLEV